MEPVSILTSIEVAPPPFRGPPQQLSHSDHNDHPARRDHQPRGTLPVPSLRSYDLSEHSPRGSYERRSFFTGGFIPTTATSSTISRRPPYTREQHEAIRKEPRLPREIRPVQPHQRREANLDTQYQERRALPRNSMPEEDRTIVISDDEDSLGHDDLPSLGPGETTAVGRKATSTLKSKPPSTIKPPTLLTSNEYRKPAERARLGSQPTVRDSRPPELQTQASPPNQRTALEAGRDRIPPGLQNQSSPPNPGTAAKTALDAVGKVECTSSAPALGTSTDYRY